MERVIALLKEKNFYLEKFFAINEHELINFGAGDFENVEAFYQARDKILDLVRCIDGLIEEENARTVTPVTTEQRKQAEGILKQKDEWVKAIVTQDLQLLEYVEKEKSNIIRELKTNQAARRAVGAYANMERVKLLED